VFAQMRVLQHRCGCGDAELNEATPGM